MFNCSQEINIFFCFIRKCKNQTEEEKQLYEFESNERGQKKLATTTQKWSFQAHKQNQKSYGCLTKNKQVGDAENAFCVYNEIICANQKCGCSDEMHMLMNRSKIYVWVYMIRGWQLILKSISISMKVAAVGKKITLTPTDTHSNEKSFAAV